MRAMFQCSNLEEFKNQDGEIVQETISMTAVIADDNPEHNQFSEATPSGELVMMVSNPEAFGFFECGKDYYLDFSPAE